MRDIHVIDLRMRLRSRTAALVPVPWLASQPVPPGAPRCRPPCCASTRLFAAAGASSCSSGLLMLVAAVPFAARQSEHLSSGGFEVPGSQSAAVDHALGRFPGVPRAQLAAVLVPSRARTRSSCARRSTASAAAAGPVDGVSLTADGRAAAERQAAARADGRRPAARRGRRGRGDRRRGRPARGARRGRRRA